MRHRVAGKGPKPWDLEGGLVHDEVIGYRIAGVRSPVTSTSGRDRHRAGEITALAHDVEVGLRSSPQVGPKLARATGFEPATLTIGRFGAGRSAVARPY